METTGKISKDNLIHLLRSFAKTENKYFKQFLWLKYLKYRLYFLLEQHSNKEYWSGKELSDLRFIYFELKTNDYRDIDFYKVNKASNILIK